MNTSARSTPGCNDDNCHRNHGFTLIEFIVALVIIGIAGAALLSAFITPVTNSADPQLIAQSRAIATSYMDEILLRDFGTGTCGGASREDYDTIWCYDGLNEPPTDQFGNTIGALSDYNVDVTVAGDATTATIVVNVSHPTGTGNLTLESRRGNY
ncbi:MAG: prepilin-type N-terminal cleavage/methylation domain-containing protein [Wenzhouxiangellaceae bacterium]